VRAVRIVGAGGTDVLELADVDAPQAGPSEVLVEVQAAGLNRADCLQRKGHYPAPEGTVQDIPGLEYAGTVAALGPGCSRWKPGDRVMGICAGGAMATHLVVHEDTCIPVPENLKLMEAAAIPEVFLTAYDALSQGGFASSSKVLIHAIGSGVGTAALQLVTEQGAMAIGTSRSASKLERASEIGLAHSILVEDGNFAKQAKSISEDGVDIILDFVGAAYLKENIKALAPKGRLIMIGLLGGAKAELPLGLVLAKRLTLIGTVLRNRSLPEKVALTEAFSQSVLPSFSAGELRPVIDRVLPMEEIAQAHEYMESNQSFGKIVLCW
jgi:putative PIG3 family NAD(P)H quinone oxidoreductase